MTMADGGAIWEISAQTLGDFASLQVTMDRYGHQFKGEDHRRAMDEIAGESIR